MIAHFIALLHIIKNHTIDALMFLFKSKYKIDELIQIPLLRLKDLFRDIVNIFFKIPKYQLQYVRYFVNVCYFSNETLFLSGDGSKCLLRGFKIC